MNKFEYENKEITIEDLLRICNEPLEEDEIKEIDANILSKKLCSCENGGCFVIHPIHLVDPVSKKKNYNL